MSEGDKTMNSWIHYDVNKKSELLLDIYSNCRGIYGMNTGSEHRFSLFFITDT